MSDVVQVEEQCNCRSCQAERAQGPWLMTDRRGSVDPGARARAMVLLRRHLHQSQRDSLKKRGFFAVRSQYGDVYHLYEDSRTVCVRGINKGVSLCIQLPGYPPGDALLARMLLLQHDEVEFLRTGVNQSGTAIVYPKPTGPGWRQRLLRRRRRGTLVSADVRAPRGN